MSPPTIKITRSRTAQARLKTNIPARDALREIIRRADVEDKPKSKKRCKMAGVRFGDIGGSNLSSTISLDDDPTNPDADVASSSAIAAAVETRSVGQTCQPRVQEFECQTISCIRCGNLGHTAPVGRCP